MKNLLLTMAAMLGMSAHSAFAVSFNFDFQVNSSGTSMYACNAGIRHVYPATPYSLCYNKVTNASCTKNEANCVCTGMNSNVWTTFGTDAMKINYSAWQDNQELPTVINSTIVNSLVTGPDYNSLSNNEFDFTKQITSLTVDLASEVYGTEYYVDICYRGPQIDNAGNGVTNNFTRLIAQTTTTNLKEVALDYPALSNLATKVEVTCSTTNNSSTTVNNTPPTNLDLGKVNFVSSTMPVVTGNTQILFHDLGVTLGDVQANFCRTRYSFTEKSAAVRKWKLQQAKISLYTKIYTYPDYWNNN